MARALSKISTPKAKKEQKVKIKHVKPKASSTKAGEIKPYTFVTGETKYVGNEPTWETQPTRDRTSKLARAFYWYSYFFQQKEGKPMFLQWVELKRGKDEAKTLKGLNENEFNLTMCWLSRMNLMGLELLPTELERLTAHIDHLHSLRAPVVELASKPVRPSIQDNIRKKSLEIAGEIEGAYDDWVRSGAKPDAAPSPIDIMRAQNLVPAQVPLVQETWERELAELKSIATDKAVAECYDKYTKIQIRNMVKFVEQVISDCASYIQVKKVERKPRAIKKKTPEQLTRTFKYLKEFPELKLKSESPAKLVAAQEAWLYDTAKRKLIHVVADINAGSITVKGTSIVGFGEKDTVMKTLRKPTEQIKEVFAGGKPAARKAFKDIKTTEAKWSGRSNENIIILKVW